MVKTRSVSAARIDHGGGRDSLGDGGGEVDKNMADCDMDHGTNTSTFTAYSAAGVDLIPALLTRAVLICQPPGR